MDENTEVLEKVGELFRSVGEAIAKILEQLKEAIEAILKDGANPNPKPNYKLVKSLIKPYKQPIIKVRYRARANL